VDPVRSWTGRCNMCIPHSGNDFTSNPTIFESRIGPAPIARLSIRGPSQFRGRTVAHDRLGPKYGSRDCHSRCPQGPIGWAAQCRCCHPHLKSLTTFRESCWPRAAVSRHPRDHFAVKVENLNHAKFWLRLLEMAIGASTNSIYFLYCRATRMPPPGHDMVEPTAISHLSIWADVSRHIRSFINCCKDYGFDVAYASFDQHFLCKSEIWPELPRPNVRNMTIRRSIDTEKQQPDVFSRRCAYVSIDPGTISWTRCCTSFILAKDQ
jgi:hypothetical protein